MPVKQQQSGFALLLFMVVMIGFITAGVSGLLSSSVKQKNEQAKVKTQQALLKAKEALLSYAVDYKIQNDLDQMGKLPCPDVTNIGTEGNQDPNCGVTSVNSVGLFPYKSLGLGKVEDANGECLWYIVSGDYKNSPSAEMLNRDSVGYLNVVDENGNLKHGASKDEYPVALIISPGKALAGQDRSPDVELPECHANFDVTNYLEGGVNIDYSTDHPATADTLWQFLDTSESAYLENADHNDQVIAIYRRELWDRVEALNDLVFDNSSGVAPASPIENLTKSLAECIAAYGNTVAQRRIPYPAPLDLIEYRVNNNYDDVPTNYGRFPQVLDTSAIPHNNFVLDTSAAQSYCESAGVTIYDELLWKNWKDHFFYWVSEDFDTSSAVPFGNKCTGAGPSAGCITVDGNMNKIAAVILFSGKALSSQSRIWWWDSASSSEDIDDKSDQNNYLEGGAATVYGGSTQNYNLTATDSDYAYCVEYSGSTLSAIKCADL